MLVRTTGSARDSSHHCETLKEFIEVLRSLSPIQEVIGGHVQLRRSGSQLTGRCPFHSDKSPSFSVSVNKQVFHCHGCGAGGDVFTFIQKQANCSFPDAVKLLAHRAGIAVDGFIPSPELTAKVADAQAHRAEELAFEKFCNDRITVVNRHYRQLSRAATHAENCLRAGERDPRVHEAAWDTLERFRTFEARVEREGLLDISLLRDEWQANGGHHVAA